MALQHKPIEKIFKIILVAAVYFALATASLQFSLYASNASPIWPASGFAFAILLLGGRYLAAGIFLGAFAANLFDFINQDTLPLFSAAWLSAWLGLGNMFSALTGYYLLNKFVVDLKVSELFKKVRHVLYFLFAAGLMCLVSCTIGASGILISNIISPSEYISVWFTWWIGDLTGILLLTPFLVVWFVDKIKINHTLGTRRIIEMVILIVAITITSGTVFFNWFNPDFVFTRAFIVTPFLIWASVRLNLYSVTALLLFSAIIVNFGTLSGIGPFIGPTLNDSLLTTEAFISVNCIMALVLNSAIGEQRNTELWLRTTRDHLEMIVKERTKELQAKNAELESRNYELSSFNYSASHDLKAPLRKIETFSTQIIQLEKEHLSEKSKEYFRRLQNATGMMRKLIDNLLAYLHVNSKEKLFEITDLSKLLNEVKISMAEMIDQQEVCIEEAKLPVVNVIPFQFEQLFTNILSNSIKFRKADVAPHILIETEIIEGSIVPAIGKDSTMLYHHISFHDNGIGIEDKDAEKIFEIFHRLHGQAEYEGTGIGLAICKKIMDNHHGFITATGIQGKGMSIHIYLPVQESTINKEKKSSTITSIGA